MSEQNELHVSIGEVKVGTGSDVLKGSFGSCVGIAFIWREKKLYGLAHCLLPEAIESTQDIGGRFVSQAVPSLIKLMTILERDRSQIEAVLVGGGNMTAPINSPPGSLVGDLNVIAAEKYLKKFGIPIVYREVGGQTGHRIRLNCETGEYLVSKIPRIKLEAA